MTLPLIFVLRIDSNFVDFFVLPRAAFEIRFLIVVPAESTKWVRFYSRRLIKMKNMKLLRQFFYVGFISFQRKKRRTNINVNGGYCRITIQWFCTMWLKVANRVAWKLMCELKVKYFDKYNVCEKYDLSQTFLGRLPLAQLNYREAISNLEIFFFRLAPLPTEFANAAPSEKFHFWFGPLQAILREKRGYINWSKLPLIREFWSPVAKSERLSLYKGDTPIIRGSWHI